MAIVTLLFSLQFLHLLGVRHVQELSRLYMVSKEFQKNCVSDFYPWQSSGFYWSDLPIFWSLKKIFCSFLEASFSRLLGPIVFVLFAISPNLGGMYRYKKQLLTNAKW